MLLLWWQKNISEKGISFNRNLKIVSVNRNSVDCRTKLFWEQRFDEKSYIRSTVILRIIRGFKMLEVFRLIQ